MKQIDLTCYEEYSPSFVDVDLYKILMQKEQEAGLRALEESILESPSHNLDVDEHIEYEKETPSNVIKFPERSYSSKPVVREIVPAIIERPVQLEDRIVGYSYRPGFRNSYSPMARSPIRYDNPLSEVPKVRGYYHFRRAA